MSNDKVRLIIEIDKEVYKNVKDKKFFISPWVDTAIKNGIPYNPSGDLISREALKETLKNRHYNYKSWNQLFSAVMETIDNAPTVPQINIFCENADETATADLKAELQSVLDSERQKGKWKKDNIGIYCSICKCHIDVESPFCPLCGADMRGGAE